jgi:hypothetical protein
MQAARTAIATGVFAKNTRTCMHLLLTDSLRAWASIRRVGIADYSGAGFGVLAQVARKSSWI